MDNDPRPGAGNSNNDPSDSLDYDYDSLAATTAIEDITPNKGNQEILRRLKDNDPTLDVLCLFNEGDADDYCCNDGADLGWLGHFVASNSHLFRLCIFSDFDDVHPRAVGRFYEQVVQNESIQSLFLCNLDEDTVGGLFNDCLGQLLNSNRNLSELDLVHCELGTDALRKLSLAIGGCRHESLTRISFQDIEYAENRKMVEVIAAMAMHPKLENISFRSVAGLGRNSYVALSTLLQWRAIKLLSLRLKDVAMGSQGVRILEPALTNISLEHMDLSSNGIGDGGAEILSRALSGGSICILRLCDNGITARGCRALSNLLQPHSKLEKLLLFDNDIRDEGVCTLASALADNRTLTTLGLFSTNDRQNGITLAGWSVLEQLVGCTSSINDTYLSNHVLTRVHKKDPHNSRRNYLARNTELVKMLQCNRIYPAFHDKRKVARVKILKCHSYFDMRQFLVLEQDFKMLPLVLEWLEYANATDAACAIDTADIARRMLSTIYQFVLGMPELSVLKLSGVAGESAERS